MLMFINVELFCVQEGVSINKFVHAWVSVLFPV